MFINFFIKYIIHKLNKPIINLYIFINGGNNHNLNLKHYLYY